MFFYPFWSEMGYQFRPFWSEIGYGLCTLVLNFGHVFKKKLLLHHLEIRPFLFSCLRQRCRCRNRLSRALVTRRAPGRQVWNRARENHTQILIWNKVQPLPIFLEEPPGIFGRRFRTQKAGHCTRRSLRRPWKLWLRIVAWSKPRMPFAKKAFRAFPKRVGPRILSLESVDYFGASEH